MEWNSELRIIMKINIFAVLCVAVRLCAYLCVWFAENGIFLWWSLYSLAVNEGQFFCELLLYPIHLLQAQTLQFDLCAFLVKCFDLNWLSFPQYLLHLQSGHCKTVFNIQLTDIQQLLSIKSSFYFRNTFFSSNHVIYNWL